MLVGLVVCELHLPHSRSLKAKRKVVKGLVERIHHRYKVSVVESGFHDLHQRAEIAVALLALSEREIDQRMNALRRLTEESTDAQVTRWDEQVLEAAP